MIRERLKDIDIKITELANYLNISRPTMYKFIDSYDNGEKESISKPVLQLFDYIESDESIGKNNVIAFILNNLAEIKENDVDEVNKIVSAVKQYVSSNPTSEKTQFITKCVSTNELDIIIHYLMEVLPLLKKDSLENNNSKKVNLYKNIMNIYLIPNEEEK